MSLSPQQQAACDAEAHRRVERALNLIEEAQGKLGDACAVLSSLQYAAPAWRATSKLYDRVKDHWYRVRNTLELGPSSQRVRLDPMAAQALLARLGASAAADRRTMSP